MGDMFNEAAVFNQNIGNWDVRYGYKYVILCSLKPRPSNQDGSWNVGNVTNMYEYVLSRASAFNQNIGRGM
jgi:hypothetical protein